MTQLFGDRARHRQRHRLLVDLRRQPAHHALRAQPRWPRPGLVQLALRGQRRVRPGHAPGRRQAERIRPRAGLEADSPPSATIWRRPSSTPTSRPKPASSQQRERVSRSRRSWPHVDSPTARDLLARRRHPGQEERLDRRRRRLGLRHRLRRPRPRARLRPQRQHPGAGHRGLLQHRRPDVEVHAARRGGQVRRRRQAGRQEGPGA